jgi:hypothetical protein
MLGSAELDRRFSYHSPDPLRAADHERVRSMIRGLADHLDYALPDGREKSTSLTHLEDAMFWANAAIARQDK